MTVVGPSWTYCVVVDRVIDGDTLKVCVDLGFTITKRENVRLLGINAPELSTTAGKAAAAWVRLWVAQHPHLVATTAKGNDKYGRWLATIIDSDTGATLNDDVVAAGHAHLWGGTGPKP